MTSNLSLQFLERLLRGLWGRSAGTKLTQMEQPVSHYAADQVEKIREVSSGIQLPYLKGNGTCAEEPNLPLPFKCFSGL